MRVHHISDGTLRCAKNVDDGGAADETHFTVDLH
jgi:hypothetical protein